MKKIKLFLGVLFIIIGALIIDQSSKIFMEKKYLIENNNIDVYMYKNKRELVFSLGKSPSSINFNKDNISAQESSFWFEFSFTYIRNRSSAFGLLSKMSSSFRDKFYILNILFVLPICLFFLVKIKNKLLNIVLCFFMSGILGNFLDRIQLKYVIDWINIRWKLYSWVYNFPSFNIADILIIIPTLITIYYIHIYLLKNK